MLKTLFTAALAAIFLGEVMTWRKASGLLLGGAGAAVAATAAVVAGATPAAANNGDPLTLGSEGNAASSPTALTTSGTDFFPALTIEATGPYNSALRAEAGTALKPAFDARAQDCSSEGTGLQTYCFIVCSTSDSNCPAGSTCRLDPGATEGFCW